MKWPKAENRKSTILPTKKVDLFAQNQKEAPLKFDLFSKKLSDFCYECGKQILKMKDHIHRTHPRNSNMKRSLGCYRKN